MDYLREEDGQLRIGAMTRESSLEESELITNIGNAHLKGLKNIDGVANEKVIFSFLPKMKDIV